MIKKLPRWVFVVNWYGLFLVIAAVVLLVLAILGANGLDAVDLVVVAAILGAFAVYQQRRHLRQSPFLADDAASLMGKIRKSHKFVLLAFESEYCPMCLSAGNRVARLEALANEDFQVYRLSIQKEPGRTLYTRYDGRLTPTYILIDSAGNVIQDWPMVLPVERITYALRQRLQQA